MILPRSLGAVNHVSVAISHACPYGNREFLDMPEPKPGEEYGFHKKSDHTGHGSKAGIAGLLEETMRYAAMMPEYGRVCREEERDGKWINRKNKFAARKEAAINDGFTVTKLPGLLPRLQHHTRVFDTSF